jgi:CBS domain-containing protein
LVGIATDRDIERFASFSSASAKYLLRVLPKLAVVAICDQRGQWHKANSPSRTKYFSRGHA